MSAWAMHGLQTTGQPWIDPVTLQPSRFPFDGDPIAGTGWLDTNASDRRMLVSVGPLTLASGQQTHLVFAIVLGQGNNRLASIEQLRCNAAAVRAAWPNGLTRPFPPALSACAPVAEPSCPWPAEAWSAECVAPTNLTAAQLDAIANGFLVDSRSFDPGFLSPRDAFCADLAQADSARQRAERQYETLLANYGAQLRSILPVTGHPIGLPLDAPVSCPGLSATTVAELLERCPDADLAADYVRVDEENPRDLQPIDWGGNAYEGGIGYGRDFLGSALDPAFEPDSFRTVEIRFGPGQTQKAHRYLRLTNTQGGPPPKGRAYLYGGYRDVPFRCVEVATGRTLEAMFTETAMTDDFGTILPSNQQPATFDSTWSPDEGPDGGREYLMVTTRSAADGPRPEFQVNGYPISGLAPITYALWLRRNADTDAIEDGEFIQILSEPPPSPGVDRAMVMLARADPSDPATILAYEGIASCLSAINLGQLSPATCTGGTPALASLVDASATAEAVTLAWYVAGAEGRAYSLERRVEQAEWVALATVAADGDGFVRYVDRGVLPGAHLTYRLVGHDPAGGHPAGRGRARRARRGRGARARGLRTVFRGRDACARARAAGRRRSALRPLLALGPEADRRIAGAAQRRKPDLYPAVGGGPLARRLPAARAAGGDGGADQGARPAVALR
jgi:hypothetical protein